MNKLGWEYIFKLFIKGSPGFIDIYQDKCRVYLDEYPEQKVERNIYLINRTLINNYTDVILKYIDSALGIERVSDSYTWKDK